MFSLASYRVTIMKGYKMALFLEVGVSVGCVSCCVSYNVIVFSILPFLPLGSSKLITCLTDLFATLCRQAGLKKLKFKPVYYQAKTVLQYCAHKTYVQEILLDLILHFCTEMSFLLRGSCSCSREEKPARITQVVPHLARRKHIAGLHQNQFK